MSDYMITGNIYFTADMSGDCLTKFSYYLWDIARTNGVGVCVGYNIPPVALQKITASDINERLPFFVSDNPWSSECDELFGNIGYEADTFKIADISMSGMRRLENFLSDIMKSPEVSHIILNISFYHGWPADVSEYTIRAADFCKAIIDAPNNNCDMPIVELTIIK